MRAELVAVAVVGLALASCEKPFTLGGGGAGGAAATTGVTASATAASSSSDSSSSVTTTASATTGGLACGSSQCSSSETCCVGVAKDMCRTGGCPGGQWTVACEKPSDCAKGACCKDFTTMTVACDSDCIGGKVVCDGPDDCVSPAGDMCEKDFDINFIETCQ